MGNGIGIDHNKNMYLIIKEDYLPLVKNQEN